MKIFDKITEIIERIKLSEKERDDAHKEACGLYHQNKISMPETYPKYLTATKKQDDAVKELTDLGFQFECEDYGDDYCLCPEGLLHVIDVLKKLEDKNDKKD